MNDRVLKNAISQDNLEETYHPIRVVRWYEKNGDKLIGESRLKDIKLSDIQNIFGESKDNPMYDCYPIATSHANSIQNFLEDKIQLGHYDYFVECDRTE